jgi:hypothetical protein
MKELNEALSWLAAREGNISFSATPEGVPIVSVECLHITRREAEEGNSADDRFEQVEVYAGDVAGAVLGAIKKARGRPDDALIVARPK